MTCLHLLSFEGIFSYISFLSIYVHFDGNDLFFVMTRMVIEWTLRYLYLPPNNPPPGEAPIFHSDSNFKCKLAIDFSRNLLVSNGAPGHLQFYSLAADASSSSFHSSLAVIPSYIRVSKTEFHTRLYRQDISFFAFSHNLSTTNNSRRAEYFLATVDVRRGEEIGIEYSLKIFKFEAKDDAYKLVAQIDNPHGVKNKIMSLTMQQNESIGALTTASDGSIKLWSPASSSLSSPSDAKQDGLSFVNLFSFKYRDAPVHNTCFSMDNSILAITYENVVALWDPIRCLLRSFSDDVLFGLFCLS